MSELLRLFKNLLLQKKDEEEKKYPKKGAKKGEEKAQACAPTRLVVKRCR
jgi:hypothetical protein